ncbi:MAG: glycosyltransferase [Candidatus Freyarchaeota archaeon]
MKLSIVICAYNEERGIRNLLENLSSQKLPPEIKDYEIIVVASGCTDRTALVVKEFMNKNPKITLIEEAERRGKAAAINKALAVATGDYIAFVPADVLPAENGLYNLIIPLRDPKVVLVSGRPMQNPKYQRNGLIGYIMNMTYRMWSRMMKTLNDMGLAAHSSGEFMAMRAKVVTRIPEECVADDSYIAVKARERGLIKFAPNAIGYNLLPSNLLDYINQRRRWLYGHFQTYRLTGRCPTVVSILVFRKPQLVLKILLEEIRERPRDVPYLACAALLEGVLYLLTMFDNLLNRQYTVWPIIKSTKISY